MASEDPKPAVTEPKEGLSLFEHLLYAIEHLMNHFNGVSQADDKSSLEHAAEHVAAARKGVEDAAKLMSEDAVQAAAREGVEDAAKKVSEDAVQAAEPHED
jgi:hypothetical protein